MVTTSSSNIPTIRCAHETNCATHHTHTPLHHNVGVVVLTNATTTCTSHHCHIPESMARYCTYTHSPTLSALSLYLWIVCMRLNVCLCVVTFLSLSLSLSLSLWFHILWTFFLSGFSNYLSYTLSLSPVTLLFFSLSLCLCLYLS